MHLCSQPWWSLYTLPFLSFHPLLAYAYSIKYVDRLKSEEWTYLACLSLGTGHALSFLATRSSTATRAFVTYRSVGSIQDVDCHRLVPVELRGEGGLVSLRKKDVGEVSFLSFEQID